jgi:hypothetical protein
MADSSTANQARQAAPAAWVRAEAAQRARGRHRAEAGRWYRCRRRRGSGSLGARKMSGWPKRCTLARGFLWEHSCKRLKLAQLLGQHGAVLTWSANGPQKPWYFSSAT